MKMSRLWRFLLLCAVAALTSHAQSTNELPELLPPYAALPPTFWEQHGLTVGLLSLVCLAAVGGVIWGISRPKPVPILPPEVQARRALEALRAQPETGVVLTQISQILRRYISAAFALPTGELTTQELVSAMKSSQALDDKMRQATSEFLESCDSRKFAPAETAPLQNAVSLALGLIEQGESVRTARSSAATKSPA